MKLKMRDKLKIGLKTSSSLITVSLLLFNLSLSPASSTDSDLNLPVPESNPHLRPSPHTTSIRLKRQLYRQSIPQNRPLSGNLYAEHHGFPHPGRWHPNPQGIVGPNSNSGHHFEEPNVILTDEDFNRFGSTLQHIDEMIHRERVRGGSEPLTQGQVGQVVNYGQGLPPVVSQHQGHQKPGHQFLGPSQSLVHHGHGGQNLQNPHQGPSPSPVDYGHGQIQLVPDNQVHQYGNNGPTAPEIVHHHGPPNPVIPVVAHYHYNHQLSSLKGSRTVKYLPGPGQTGPGPAPSYGSELRLPQYNLIGPEHLVTGREVDFDFEEAPPGPLTGPLAPSMAPPIPFKLKEFQNGGRFKGPSLSPNPSPAPYVFSIQPQRGGKFGRGSRGSGYFNLGGLARKPVRYSTQIPGAYSWSIAYRN